MREDRLIAERFESLANQLLSEIERHQGVHEQTLRAGAAILSIMPDVNAAQWRSLYDNLRVAENLPGIQGYGFAEAVSRDERAAHVARIRAQGFPKYDVTPSGERDFYTPIAYLEPLDLLNQRAHGYDMYSEPERRAAMARAADSGATAATGRVRLVQEGEAEGQAGFLLYVPVYRAVVGEGARGRHPGLKGFVYSPVRVTDFFGSLMRVIQSDMTQLAVVEVFDGSVASPEALIFTSGERRNGLTGFSIEREHDLFGRKWTVRMSPLPAFLESVDYRARREILFGGLAISLMAAALVWLVAQRQLQREEAALRNQMVAREMSHRVKNLLAVIQSIASRTLTGGRTLQEARSVFSDRLAALARAHSALVDGQWSGASLGHLLEGELAPFGARVSMRGPFLRINSQMAQNMAMAVHELATNAMKYGALSDNAGVVRITWAVRAAPSGEVFSFSWEEIGGPPTSDPEREGFGQTLLRRLIGATIGAEPVTEYPREGFRYRFECPLERIVGAPGEGQKD
ncbi:MAG: CHASE domain-containing protein [Beijerinckiaceae bacterium]